MTRILRSLLVVVAAFALARGAAAQDLNDLWFKLKVKANGYAVDPTAETTKKGKISMTVYLHLTESVADGGGGSLPATTYGFELWCETSPGTWEVVSHENNDIETVDGINYFATDIFLETVDADGQVLDGYCTDLIKVKRDKEGNIKSASYKSLGGELIDGTSTGDDALRGGLARSGKLVAVDKLPFSLD